MNNQESVWMVFKKFKITFSIKSLSRAEKIYANLIQIIRIIWNQAANSNNMKQLQ